MLSFKNRLLKKSDFDKTYKEGVIFSSKRVRLKIRKNNRNEARIGISVGLGYSKKSTERNRAKRQIREIFREKLPEIKEGIDMIVFLKKKGQQLDPKELKKEIEEIFEKNKLKIIIRNV